MAKRKGEEGAALAGRSPSEGEGVTTVSSRRTIERKAFKKAKRAAGKAAARAEAAEASGAGKAGKRKKKAGAAEADDDDESERRERAALAAAVETGEVELSVEGPGAVEGRCVGDALYLIDKITARVFSSVQRGPAAEFVCVGTWDTASSSIRPFPRKEPRPDSAATQGEPAWPAAPTHVEHPFEAAGDDHCETSPQAHADIAPLLAVLAKRLGKAPAELRIYDPYFCAGGTVRNLAALGFTHVINRNEDFYLAIEEGTVPEHDVVVTNPPYSEDHVARALTFCAANLATHGRPWLMLLPNYVYAKDYYRPALREGAREGVEQRAKADATVFAEGGPEAIPLGCSAADAANAFYIAPKKRYYYWTPKALKKESARARSGGDDAGGQKKKRTHSGPLGERTSPFLSFWYCGVGEHQANMLNKPDAILNNNEHTTCVLATTPKQLPSILQAT